MSEEETLTKMNEMRLGGMASAFRELLADAPGNALSWTERVGIMTDREWLDRENRRMARLLRHARLPVSACLEDIWCDPSRGGLDKALVRELATGKWIDHHHNIIVVGKTGCGKTYLAAALADAACRRGLRSLCVRVPRLAHELALAHADGSLSGLLAKLAKLDLLVLDDFLLAPPKDQERRDLLEILEDRYGKRSTIITTQLPTKNWHEALADPTIADAICDRVVHNAHVIALTGRSIRNLKGLNSAKTKLST